MTDTTDQLHALLTEIAPMCPDLYAHERGVTLDIPGPDGGRDCYRVTDPSFLNAALIVAWVQAECKRRGWSSTAEEGPCLHAFLIHREGRTDEGEEVWHLIASTASDTLALAALTALRDALTAEVQP